MSRMLMRRFGRALAAASIVAVAFTFGAQAQTPSGKPIVIGQTLALTGPLGQTGMVHKIVGEIMIEDLNKAGGLLGRPVEWKLYDDESKGATARTQYERLITVDKVDLIIGPYATEGILAAMTVAQRYKKLYIQKVSTVLVERDPSGPAFAKSHKVKAVAMTSKCVWTGTLTGVHTGEFWAAEVRFQAGSCTPPPPPPAPDRGPEDISVTVTNPANEESDPPTIAKQVEIVP